MLCFTNDVLERGKPNPSVKLQINTDTRPRFTIKLLKTFCPIAVYRDVLVTFALIT